MCQYACRFLLAIALVAQQPSINKEFLVAMSRLQSGDAAGAAKLLESVTSLEPANAAAWRAYGLALQRTRQWQKALQAHTKALELEPSNVTPLMNIAIAHAGLGHHDQALEWLARAKATKNVDMSQLETNPVLQTLKADSRFASLLPDSEDFKDPFVESVKVIHEWDGEDAGDQFGWIARNIGDVDGDGVPDLVTSAPSHHAGGAEAGRIYVYSTRSGRLLWKADGRAHDQLGTGVEGAGDTDGDGIPDVVAGAPGSGHAYVYSGLDGRVLLTLSSERGKEDQFGIHASGVGDIDHDGHADVIIGAPDNNAGGAKAGRAYVFSGKDGHSLLTLTGERPGDNFGSAVTGYADGTHTFIVVGAPNGGPRKAGRVYVYDSLSNRPKFTIDSDESGAALGAMFLGVIGDVDGDGIPDIYASDWSNNAKGWSTGRVYIHSGKDGHRILTLTGETAGEGFGIGPGRAGDIDGDGRADLIVGSWQYAGAAFSGGRVSLFSGRTGGVLATLTGRIPGDTLGFDAIGMGDVDGDGTIDFLIASAWSAIHGFHSGRMFLVSGGFAAKPTNGRATGR